MLAVLSLCKLNHYFELLLCSLVLYIKSIWERKKKINLNIILLYKLFSAVLICFILVLSLKLRSKKFLEVLILANEKLGMSGVWDESWTRFSCCFLALRCWWPLNWYWLLNNSTQVCWAEGQNKRRAKLRVQGLWEQATVFECKFTLKCPFNLGFFSWDFWKPFSCVRGLRGVISHLERGSSEGWWIIPAALGLDLVCFVHLLLSQGFENM